jgi:hypothetical protein
MLNSLTTKELKVMLAERKVDYSDCVEKSDLVAKIIETQGINLHFDLLKLDDDSNHHLIFRFIFIIFSC